MLANLPDETNRFILFGDEPLVEPARSVNGDGGTRFWQYDGPAIAARQAA